MFLLPGIIWLYYGFSSDVCNSPLDDYFNLFKIFYLVVFGVLFVCTIIAIVDFNLDKYYSINALLVYVLVKLGLGMTMLVIIQHNYYNGLESNECPSLKSLTIFWLVWNYIFVLIHLIYFLFSLIFSICGHFTNVPVY